MTGPNPLPATLAGRRHRASPYARKLARARGLSLDLVTGTGPLGRITAADILSAPAPVAAAPSPPAAAPQQAVLRAPSAFAARIDLAPLRDFIARAASAGLVLSLQDIALRAAAWALVALDLPETAGAGALTLEQDGRQILLGGGAGLSVGSQRRARDAALDSGRDDAGAAAALSVQFFASGRVAPVLMPLLPGRALRLRLSAAEGGDLLSALLCSDPDLVPDDQAAAFLEGFAETLEMPLALLA